MEAALAELPRALARRASRIGGGAELRRRARTQGQNFLTCPQVLSRFAAAAGPMDEGTQLTVDIGAGGGGLSACSRRVNVVAVERPACSMRLLIGNAARWPKVTAAANRCSETLPH